MHLRPAGVVMRALPMISTFGSELILTAMMCRRCE